MIVDGKKRCSKCREWKVVDEFHKHRISKDGLHSRCKSCRKIYCNHERIKAYAKIYYKANRERLITYQKAYYLNHYERLKAYSRAYFKIYNVTHREERKAYAKIYRAVNRERIKAYSKAYYLAHYEEISARKKRWWIAKRKKELNSA